MGSRPFDDAGFDQQPRGMADGGDDLVAVTKSRTDENTGGSLDGILFDAQQVRVGIWPPGSHQAQCSRQPLKSEIPSGRHRPSCPVLLVPALDRLAIERGDMNGGHRACLKLFAADIRARTAQSPWVDMIRIFAFPPSVGMDRLLVPFKLRGFHFKLRADQRLPSRFEFRNRANSTHPAQGRCRSQELRKTSINSSLAMSERPSMSSSWARR